MAAAGTCCNRRFCHRQLLAVSIGGAFFNREILPPSGESGDRGEDARLKHTHTFFTQHNMNKSPVLFEFIG